MTTRIRQIRKLRGLTLQQLADLVGTTPQTIQRLETNNMTVSVDWLERIGNALAMNPAMLLTSYGNPSVPLVGELGVDGAIKRGSDKKRIEITVPIEDPIAVALRDRFGPHEPGTILIANRVSSPKSRDADGRDCVVELKDGKLIFRRVVQGRGGTTAYVPYEDGSNIERNLEIVWLAPVVMAVRYLPVA
jgi:transcriptional regulator with XRE-family HTH domain